MRQLGASPSQRFSILASVSPFVTCSFPSQRAFQLNLCGWTPTPPRCSASPRSPPRLGRTSGSGHGTPRAALTAAGEAPHRPHAPSRHRLAPQDAHPSSARPAGPARRCYGNGAAERLAKPATRQRREEVATATRARHQRGEVSCGAGPTAGQGRGRGPLEPRSRAGCWRLLSRLRGCCSSTPWGSTQRLGLGLHNSPLLR